MPGVVNMENGGQNGVRTNHDRDLKLNGVTGAKAAGPQDASNEAQASGGHGTDVVNGGKAEPEGSRPPAQASEQQSIELPYRMNDLPDEIHHITQGFVPLSRLLSRLAQTTHNSLQEKIAELAKMPIPATALNGNTTQQANATDDISTENLRKKATILAFAQEMHARWVKALVITEWSRKSDKVSKLIDLKFHLDQQRILYDVALDDTVNMKRDLTYARMPSPDLKTALQVLSTGKAAWMPDLNYIEAPPLSPQEQAKWINDLNTLLSLRLNLEDFDKIPYQFRNYDIDSGRVTFKITGEFEVDLTIADDDFEKQFWFIDFRFAFKPSAETVPESLKRFLEGYVNDALSKDGLKGCYQFLHEFVLTHKLNELKRQALELSNTSWTGTLKVEPLNRALAIQYWASRNSGGTKSWVLVAVNTGRKQNGQLDDKSSSSLTVKWYRDNQEVKDIAIPLGTTTLSAETLLKTVIGHHINFTLTCIHETLLTAPRYKNREARMVLNLGESHQTTSSLDVSTGHSDKISLEMEPTTGLFSIRPQSKFSSQFETQLNNGGNPVQDSTQCIENVRCAMMEDELVRGGSYMGWNVKKSPLNNDELRSVVKARDSTRLIWLHRDGWEEGWFVMVLLSFGGDEWWLLETKPKNTGKAVKFQARLPLNKGYPLLSNGFWNNLTLLTTGMIAQSIALRELHSCHIKSRPSDGRSTTLFQEVRLPALEVALSGIFPLMVFNVKNNEISRQRNQASLGELASIVQTRSLGAITSSQPWADDIIMLKFKGVQPPFKSATSDYHDTADTSTLTCISDAVIKARKPAKFSTLKVMTDRDMSYNPQKGEFSLRIRHKIGEPILTILKSRVKAVDRFINFLESMEKAKGTIVSESITLREVTFSYSEPTQTSGDNAGFTPPRWRIVLDLSQENIDINLEKGNPHLRVIDLMKTLVNSDGGIEALMVWLPLSFPILAAVERIEAAWADLQATKQGRFEFLMKAVHTMIIRYTLVGQPARRLTLSIRFRVRRGQPWWNIYRIADLNQQDEFTTALKPIWEGKGDDWQGLTTSAAGRPSGGISTLMAAVDEAVRALAQAGNGPTATSDGMSQFVQNNGQQQLEGSSIGNAQVVVLD